MTKTRIIDEYERRSYYNEGFVVHNERETSIAIGIIDGIYPVALVGEGDWLQNIDDEIIYAVKTQRRSYQFETVFDLMIDNNDVQFSLPNTIARKLVERIDKSNLKDTIFEIDVPYLKKVRNDTVRRFLKIIVSLPGNDKALYIESLKNRDGE